VNKILNLLLFLIFCFLCTGCTNQYFIVDSGKETFYGSFLSRDFSQGDVQMQSEDNKIICAGVLFINEFSKTKDDNNKKASEATIQMSCNDGRVLKGLLKGYTLTNWTGEIQDQYNKKYNINVVSKKVYKEETGLKKISKKDYNELIEELVKY
jgi:hypothetical protein